MNCAICRHGTTKPGYTTVVLVKDETSVIFKNVPADLCSNCGEYYLSSEITKKLFALATEAVKKGIEVEIIRFAA